MPDKEEPKIIVDSDWKAQAQAEKEKLRAQEATAPAGNAGDGAGGQGELPQADFIELIRMLASQALMFMGAIPDPSTGKPILSPELARLHIDLLGILEEKTKGNLTDEEQSLLTQTASELRMQFVELSKAIEKAIAEGRIKPMDSQGQAPTAGM